MELGDCRNDLSAWTHPRAERFLLVQLAEGETRAQDTLADDCIIDWKRCIGRFM